MGEQIMKTFLSSLLPIVLLSFVQARSLMPPTEQMSIISNESELALFTREDNVKILHVHTEPRGHHQLIKLSLEADCVVLDLMELSKIAPFPKVVTNWVNVNQLSFPENSYEIGIDLSSSQNAPVRLYFEGNTPPPQSLHHFKRYDFTSTTTRRNFSAYHELPARLGNFHARFDFLTPDVFRIYGVTFVEQAAYDKPADAHARIPKLLFHATFDDTLDASVAGGNPTPVSQGNLTFVPGILGKAIHSTVAANSRLEYETKGNVLPNCGSISMWVNPQWGPIQGNLYNPRNYRTFFAFDQPRPRNGSGAIWFWSIGPNLRWDTSDLADSYKVAATPFENNRWYHIVMNWDEDGAEAFINGKKINATSQKPGMFNTHVIRKNVGIKTFFVGSLHRVYNSGMGLQANSYIDDLRIYSAPLSVQEIHKLSHPLIPFEASCTPPFVIEGTGQPFKVTIVSHTDWELAFTWQLADGQGNHVKTGRMAERLGGKRKLDLDIPTASLAPGNYKIKVQAENSPSPIDHANLKVCVFHKDNPWLEPANAKLERKLIHTIVPTPSMDKDRFAHVGDVHLGELNGRQYLETDNVSGSRFAIRFQLPDKNAIYLLEWDYPDDKKRTCDIIAQASVASSDDEYELQTGYSTGNEYYNTNTFITQKCLYFPRSTDTTLIFMGAREDTPAAVAEIRIYQLLSGLPAASHIKAGPVNGWERTVGVYFEDPAINYCFGDHGGKPEFFETMIDRMVAYMKYSGQNLLVYPMVWYDGLIKDSYNPRSHHDGFMEAFLTKFDRHGLAFMPSFNWQNVYFNNVSITRNKLVDGSLHPSPIAIYNTGVTNPNLWHGSSPNLNIIHPQLQERFFQYLDEFIRIGVGHSSFKGVTFHLARHCILWFGELDCGYNDYMIDGFEKETGIKLPIDRNDPLRGRAYYEWLVKNAKEEWIDYRCKILADFYKKVAARLKAARPDLILNLTVFNGYTFLNDQDYMKPEHNFQSQRRGGIDPKYYDDCDNIVLVQGTYPADYRWREEHNLPRNLDHYEHLLVKDTMPEFYTMTSRAKRPWLHMHDRYWESAVAIDAKEHWSAKPRPFKIPWLKEHTWRVSTINPSGFHAMKHYVLPLRFGDLLGITKGGYLIGTYGMEDLLIPFAKAFKALPAKRFDDLVVKSETLRARFLHDGDTTWLYVVNTSDKPDLASVRTNAKHITDLLTGQERQPSFDLDLEPYQFLSFKLEGRPTITVTPLKSP